MTRFLFAAFAAIFHATGALAAAPVNFAAAKVIAKQKVFLPGIKRPGRALLRL